MVNKLDGVHPTLVEKISRVIAAMQDLGFLMIVVEGVRTLDRQKELYASGRTKPGNIVTYCDGIIKKSNHQIREDGYSHAVDCVFIEHGRPSWNLQFPWRLYGEMVKSQGLTWGGDWKLHDYPHAELEF